jgi:hypothetical protein
MENLSGLIVTIAVAAILVWVAVYMRTGSRARQTSLLVPHPPKEAVERAVVDMVQGGFTVAHKGETSATFTRPKKPKTDTGCLLLLLGIIPGLLYFGLFRGTYSTSVVAWDDEHGSRLELSGDDERAYGRLADWARALRDDPEMLASPGSPDALAPPGSPAKDAADRLRARGRAGAQKDPGPIIRVGRRGG